MGTYLYIAAGGALGSVARYWMVQAVDDRLNAVFPYGTMAVNVAGSFAVGIFAGLAAAAGTRWSLGDPARLFLTVGLCGGFTTFSAFSLQTMALLRDGLLLRAGANVAGSVALCLLATWAGLALVQQLVRPA